MTKRPLIPTKIIVEEEDAAYMPTYSSKQHPYCPLPPGFFNRSFASDSLKAEEETGEKSTMESRTLLSVSTWDGRDILSISGKSTIYRH